MHAPVHGFLFAFYPKWRGGSLKSAHYGIDHIVDDANYLVRFRHFRTQMAEILVLM